MKQLLMNSNKNINKNIIINSDFTEYKKLFLEENSKKNLISKNDEKFLYEKHIYDSLSIKLSAAEAASRHFRLQWNSQILM